MGGHRQYAPSRCSADGVGPRGIRGRAAVVDSRSRAGICALATALAAHVAPLLTGARVLDLGAGTGVAGRAAVAAGSTEVVAADLALAPLRRGGPPVRPVSADATALPFRDRSSMWSWPPSA